MGKTIYLAQVGKAREAVALGDLISHGAAGEVFRIDGDPSRVIKLYKPEVLKKDGIRYRSKIVAMIERPVRLPPPVKPPGSHVTGDIVQLAWPIALAESRTRGDFLGFAMPALEIQHTDVLENVLQEKMAQRCGLRSDMGARLMLAHNLSAMVMSIHAEGHAVVDLKPLNVQFYKQELYLALLDCDGFHIAVPGGGALQVTPGYCAPEFIDQPVTQPELQDRFALAVIIFRLLNYGVHPYDGVPKGARVPSETNDRVRKGLFAYGSGGCKDLLPRPASTHLCVPEDLRGLFDRAFGAIPALRPSAREWQQNLYLYADRSHQKMAQCDQSHVHFLGLLCGACVRADAINQTHTAAAAPRQLAVVHSVIVAPAPAAPAAPSTPTAPSTKNPRKRGRRAKATVPASAPSGGSQGTTAREVVLGILVLIAIVAGGGWVLHFFSYWTALWTAVALSAVLKFAMPKDMTFFGALIVFVLLTLGGKWGWDSVLAREHTDASVTTQQALPAHVEVKENPSTPAAAKPVAVADRAYLGFLLGRRKGTEGILVSAIDAQGPAARAGLVVGDQITSLGRKAIANENAVKAALARPDPFTNLALTISRSGEQIEMVISPSRLGEQQWADKFAQLKRDAQTVDH